MKRWMLGLVMALVFLPTPGTTGPVEGPQRRIGVELPGGFPGEGSITFEFEKGERACVILRGDHQPVVNLGIEVYDEEKRLVARDDGIGDYAAAIWYPPAKGRYTIRLINPQPDFNRCYLLVH